MLKKNFMSALALFNLLPYGIPIKIGQKSGKVLLSIQYRVSRSQSNHRNEKQPTQRMKYEINYLNRRIRTVTVYKHQVFLTSIRKHVDVSIDYQMENGCLDNITTVYTSLTKAEVTTLKEKTSHTL